MPFAGRLPPWAPPGLLQRPVMYIEPRSAVAGWLVGLKLLGMITTSMCHRVKRSVSAGVSQVWLVTFKAYPVHVTLVKSPVPL